MKRIKIKSVIFKSDNDMGSCLHFHDGYCSVPVPQGVSFDYVKNPSWFTSPYIHGIACEVDGNMEAGLLFYQSDMYEEFPFTQLVGDSHTKSLWVEYQKRRHTKVAEVFGLWSSSKMSGLGMGNLLLKAAIAFGKNRQLDKLYYLVPEYNMRGMQRLGFSEEVQNNVEMNFMFGDANFRQKVSLCSYPYLLRQSSHKIADDLYVGKNCTVIEKAAGQELEIEYVLF